MLKSNVKKTSVYQCLHKKTHIIILILIVIISLGLRLHGIDKGLWEPITNDEARDMLVARHIADFGETINRGPFVAGGFDRLQNSPLYYYIIAGFWFLSRSPLSMTILWSIGLSILILLAYVAGKTIGNIYTGLICSSLFAFHPQLIIQSRHVFQPNLLPMFSLLLLISLLYQLNKSNLTWLCISISLLLIPLNIHYGWFAIMPVGLIWILYLWVIIILKQKSFKTVIVPYATFFFFLLLWFFSSYNKIPTDQIQFFISNFDTNSSPIILQLLSTIELFQNIVLPYVPSRLPITIGIALVLLVIIALVKKKRRLGVKNMNLLLMITFCLSIFYVAFYQGKIFSYYLFAIMPFYLILLGLSIFIVFNWNKILGLSILLGIIYICLYGLLIHFYSLPKDSFLERQKELAQSIYNDSQQLDKLNHPSIKFTQFTIAQLDAMNTIPFDGWETSGAWFLLENLFLEKLVILNPKYAVSFMPLVKNPQYIYLICDHRESTINKYHGCLNKFVQARNYLNPEPTIIFQTSIYTVWRFSIDTNKSPPHLYRVYEYKNPKKLRNQAK